MTLQSFQGCQRIWISSIQYYFQVMNLGKNGGFGEKSYFQGISQVQYIVMRENTDFNEQKSGFQT